MISGEPVVWAPLVPELIVTNLERSLAFWCGLIGFSKLYGRADEAFAYLALGRAQVMLEQASSDGSSWIAARLDHPLGRGINFQIEVPAIDPILDRLGAAGVALFRPAEEAWYRADDVMHGQREFLVQDPDGYLLRPCEIIGEPPVDAPHG